MTSGRLWNYYRDKVNGSANDNNGANIIELIKTKQ